MSDISKCEGTNCPLKDSCKRYKAKDKFFNQSYMLNVPFKLTGIGSQFVKCDEFIKWYN